VANTTYERGNGKLNQPAYNVTLQDDGTGKMAEPVYSIAGENHIGMVGGTTVLVSPAIPTTATPYTANDVVGGKLTIAGAARVSGGTGILQSVLVRDVNNQKAALTILLFNADPANGTYTDNVALTLNATDAAFIVRKINILTTDYETLGTQAVADVAVAFKPIKITAGTSLFALVITTGTPTYGANSTSLNISFGIVQD
jgi:hypothetical protein